MSLHTLPDHARVWIYTADREISPAEHTHVNEYMTHFMRDWAAHGAGLKAGFALIHQRYLVLAADEATVAASGCSIDSSVRAIKDLGSKLGIDFFNRTLVGFQDGDQLRFTPIHDFWARRKANLVTDETAVFNTLAATLGDLRRAELLPFAESWHAEMWR
jgi:hypothetical protein